jgi:hypothetical protein
VTDAVDELCQFDLVFLAIHVPAPRLVNEDGTPAVFAHDEDEMLEIFEWSSMNSVRVTRDLSEPHDAVLVAMTEGWRRSPLVAKAILRAQKAKLPLFFLDPRTWRLTPI